MLMLRGIPLEGWDPWPWSPCMIRSGIGSVMLRDPSRASSPSTEDLRPIEKVPHGTPSCTHSVYELQRSCRPGVLMFGGILMSVKLKLDVWALPA